MPTMQPEKQTASPKLHGKPVSTSTQWLMALAILMLTFIAYGPALNAGFIWDDDDMFTENELVRGPLHEIWFEAKAPFLSTKFYDYIPLTLTSYWLEYRIWEKPGADAHQMHPKPYHATNILIHALTAILFWRILRKLKIPGAWVAALIFAIHPVNVQSVAWVTERKNTLSLLFYALALWAFIKSEASSDSKPQASNPAKWFWLSIVLFLLGLLSKAAVIMLPVVLLGVLWWMHGKIDRRGFVQTIPFFALAIVFAAITISFQYHRSISTDVVRESDFAARMATAGKAVWFYAGKIFLPTQLSFIYTRWEVAAQSAAAFVPGVLVLVCLGVFWWFRKSWGQALLLGFGCFVVTLFPVLGFFNIYFQKYTLVADYWQYPATIALIALGVGMVGYFQKRFSALAYLAIPVIGLLAWQTSRQCMIYKNDETLFRDVLQTNPTCWMAHNTLGVELLQQEKYDDAFPHFEATLKIKPDHAMAHCNIGTVMIHRGDLQKAVEAYRQAYKYDTSLVEAMQPLAWIEATSLNPSLRNGPEAVAVAEQAVNVTHGENPLLLDVLAAAYAENADFAKAVDTMKKAIEIARSANAMPLAQDLSTRLREYQAHRPHRE